MSALTLSLNDHRRAALTWLHRPITYTLGAPLMMVAGAATTIIAPRLLTPASFAQFALLASVVQYAAEFDLGLGRLADRRLSGQAYQPELMRSLTLARFWLALGLLSGVLIMAPFISRLTALAGIAGIALMLCNGPLAFFRAQSKLAAFTVSALAIQAGLSLPRLAGLLVDGVAGCIIALTIWYTASAVILTIPLASLVRHRNASMRVLPLLAQSVPLFVFNSSWLLFLLANRWFAWLLSSPAETGLFAFGANLVAIGTGLITMIAQAYYPHHLRASRPTVLSRELWCLLALASLAVLIGVVLCHFFLGRLFPNFGGAEASTAALLTTGIPLSLCAWLMPLVIARSGNPIMDAAMMFGTCLFALFVGMWVGCRFGLDGLAWGSLPSTLMLSGWHLKLGARNELLRRSAVATIWTVALAISLGYGGLWWLLL